MGTTDSLGFALKRGRRALYLSQKELAARIVTEVGWRLTGKELNEFEWNRARPSDFVLKKLAFELHLDFEELRKRTA